jgi:serine/threonine-protein kinase
VDAGGHIPPEQLAAFLKGTVTPEQASQVEAHIDACEECRVLLSSLVRGQRDSATDPTHQVTVAPVTEGDVVAGKYRIEKIIGAGGMGSVISAWHQQLNQRVALKFMLPAIAADPHAAARFLREARAAARLSTPHVGRVIDLDSLPNGTPYLVMEFLEGETLAQRLTRGPLSVTQAVDAIRQALVGLAEAHALGVVHRDFKPANLFFARRPDGSEQVKVLDFGIAKSVHPDIEQGLVSTSSRMLIGSPPYMSPEQISFQNVDARTDVWAVGAVLYEMLSGKVPFEGKTVGDVMFAIQNKPHQPLATVVPAVSASLSALVDRCLAKKADARFENAQALADALTALSSVQTDPEQPAVVLKSFKQKVLSLPVPVLGGIGAAALILLGFSGMALLNTFRSHPVHTETVPRVEQAQMAPVDPQQEPAALAQPPAPVVAAPAVAPAAASKKQPSDKKKKGTTGSTRSTATNAFEERR